LAVARFLSVLYHGTSFYSSRLRYDETEYFALSAVYNCVLRYGAVIVTVNIVYLLLHAEHNVFVTHVVMLKVLNISCCFWPIMASHIQPSFKFWSATDNTRRLILVSEG
jgi:hypothetical protein